MKKILYLLFTVFCVNLLYGCEDSGGGNGFLPPEGFIRNTAIDGNQITFDLDFASDLENVEEITIVLFNGENEISQLTMDDGIIFGLNSELSFTDLAPSTNYKIVVTVVCNEGEEDIPFEIDTYEFEISPIVELNNIIVDSNKIIFDIIDNNDDYISAITVNLFQNNNLVTKIDVEDNLTALEFTDLEYDKEYLISLDVSYNNYGNVIVKEQVDISNVYILSTDNFITDIEVDKTEIFINENLNMTLSLANSQNFNIIDVVINGDSYTDFDSTSTNNNLTFEVNSGSKGGNQVFATEQVTIKYKGNEISYNFDTDNTLNLFVYEEFNVKGVHTEREYVDHREEYLVTISIDNSFGYVIESILFNGETITNFENVTEEKISFYITAGETTTCDYLRLSEITYSYKEKQFITSYVEYTRVFIGDTDNINYIYTIDDLFAMKNYSINILMNDIDLTGINWTPLKNNVYLDGNGYTISNLNITASTEYSRNTKWGFIGSIYAYIKDVYFENEIINIDNLNNTKVYVGGIAGRLFGCHIENVTATGSINVKSNSGEAEIGGLVGYASGNIVNSHSEMTIVSDGTSGDVMIGGLYGSGGGKIENSSATGDITVVNDDGNLYVGGLVGDGSGRTKNSSAIGNIIGINSNGYVYVGGLYGNFRGNINNSFAMVNIDGISSINSMYLGGLIGVNEGLINNSYATGNIKGDITGLESGEFYQYSYLGGLIGRNYKSLNGTIGIINNSYATGNVEGSVRKRAAMDLGGLVGDNDGGIITNSLATGDLRGSSDANSVVEKVYVSEVVWNIVSGIQNSRIDKVYGYELQVLYKNNTKETYRYSELIATKNDLSSKDFYINTLLFDESIWTIKEGYMPTLIGIDNQSEVLVEDLK